MRNSYLSIIKKNILISIQLVTLSLKFYTHLQHNKVTQPRKHHATSDVVDDMASMHEDLINATRKFVIPISPALSPHSLHFNPNKGHSPVRTK